MKVEREVVVERPVEEVFAYIADARNDPQWCERVLESEQVAGDGPGVGARYRQRHRPLRIQPVRDLSVEVLEYDPPRRMRIREEDADTVLDVVYELEPSGGGEGTRLVQRDDISLRVKPFEWIARFTVGRHVGQQFRALKQRLEAHS